MASLPTLPDWPEVAGHLLGAVLALGWLGVKVWLLLHIARFWLRWLP
jgi:hypothetical protein